MGTICNVIRTAYLRVYQPLEAFSPAEREHWLAHPGDDEAADPAASRKWLIAAALPSAEALFGPTEGAFRRTVSGEVLLCPWRIRLRMLAGLVAFRGTLPAEIAEAFVPEREARHAAHELAVLEANNPDIRSHILHANWHVPLRWFAAFDDGDRILTEDKSGLRVRYESVLDVARHRAANALEILENSWIDESVTGSLRELVEWLEGFEGPGLLELDYASVASMFPDEDLVDDHSAAEVAACLEALATGDLVRAGRLFGTLTERWTEVRAREVLN